MKKQICTLLSLAIIGWAGTAAANTLFYELQEGFAFDGSNTTKTWIFDLDNDPLLSSWDGSGYDPYGGPVDINPEDKITNAFIEISFFDEDNYVDPYLNANGNEKLRYRETADIVVDGVNLIVNATGIKEIDTQYFHRNITASFLNDHLLELTINRYSGDFEVFSVLVGGAFRDKPPLNNPVPEPGTLLLLGTGLAGLAAAGRKKMAR